MPFNFFEPAEQQLQLFDAAKEICDCFSFSGRLSESAKINAKIQIPRMRIQIWWFNVTRQFPFDVREMWQIQSSCEIFDAHRWFRFFVYICQFFGDNRRYFVVLKQRSEFRTGQIMFDSDH